MAPSRTLASYDRAALVAVTKIHSQINLGANRSQIGAVLGLYFTKPDVSRVQWSVAMDNFDSSSLVKKAVSTGVPRAKEVARDIKTKSEGR